MEDTKIAEIEKAAEKISKILNKPSRHNAKSIKKWEKESVDSGNVRCYLNPEWKKRWIPFIKYDWDWDFAFIDTLIVKKLKLMKEFYLHDLKKKEKDLWTTNSKDGNRKIVREINEVLKAYKEYNTTMKVGDEEKELRIKFYQKLGELSGNWWD